MASLKSGIIIGVATAGVAAAALAGGGVRWSPSSMGVQRLATTPISTATIFSPPPGAPLSFADIFEKVAPAVVSIEVTTHLSARELQGIPGFAIPNITPPGGDGSGGDDGDNDGDDSGAKPSSPKAESQGSGFFISADGYVVTNNHVVENAEDIKVTLKDGTILPAKVIGHDEATDLAVIKVEGHDFPFVDFENSAKPRVGDWVIAIGNPYGLGNTATAGIVSAYNRDIGENFVDYIQIDAPINRGNSGGPTFDTYGRVIGVNTAIFSPSGGSVGIGFDIPADIASSVTKQLMTGEKIKRGYIGATIQNLSDEMADSWGLSGRKGAVVADLVPGGPAQKAGVQAGDVVVAVNGQPVTSPNEMTREIAKIPAGDVAHLDLFRDGKERTLDIHTGLRPSEEQLARNGGPGGDGGDDDSNPATPHVNPAAPILGMNLAPLTPAMRQRFNLGDTVHGVIVEGVKGASDAGEKGLKGGDVIVRAGDREVATAADVSAAVTEWKKAGRTSIPLAINRSGRTLYVPIKIAG